jgi:hypothetical protein
MVKPILQMRGSVRQVGPGCREENEATPEIGRGLTKQAKGNQIPG